MKQPAGVVRVITRLNIGGPARQALLLSRELNGRFPTTLVAGTPPTHEGELTDAAVEVRRVPLVRNIHPPSDARALQALRGVFRETRPAIVHTHMAKAGMVGRMAALQVRPRPRTVHTFHGHVLEGYFHPSVNRLIVRVERWLAGRTDVLLAVSEKTRDDLLRLGIGRPDQYRIMPLGLELDAHFRVEGPSGQLRSALNLSDDVPLIGVVGRLAPIKDLATMLYAVSQLNGCHLAVLGDGSQRGELESLAAALGIRERVKFLGWWMDVPAAIADMDVVALSSRNEGTPVALIEAGACARPVVATDVGGVSSVVANGVTGYLVPPQDPAALAEALDRLLSSPALRAEMGGRARPYVAERYGASRLVEDIGELYGSLIS